MNAFFEWLAMGGYSMYVWPAYGLVLGVLLINLLSHKWQKRQVYLKLHRWFMR